MPVDFETRVAQYVKIRDIIRNKEAKFKEEMKQYKTALDGLDSILLNHLNSVGANSVNTDAGTVYRTEKKSASLADPKAFMDYVIANGAFDLMDRKANVNAVAAFIEQHKTQPPGVNFNSIYTVGVRRPNQEK
jgi:hypothetical protein